MAEAQTLTDRFRSSIGNTGAVQLVERSLMDKILEAQGFQHEKCTTDECVATAGELLGVQFMIGGAIGKLGGTFTIDVRMISVETGETVRTRNVSYVGEVDGLIVEVEILAYQMVDVKPPRELLARRTGGVEIPSVEAGAIAQGEDTRPTVAVIDFEGRGITILEAKTLTDRFRTSINNTGSIRLVERGVMEEVLQEQGFQQTGCISDECAVEVGQLLGVQYMVSGSIGRVGETFTIDARMISIQTGASLRTKNITYVGKVDGLITEIEILAFDMVEMEPPAPLLKKRKLAARGIEAPQRVPGQKTKLGAMMRSLVFPGFGQFYAEKKLWGYGWIFSELAVAGLMYSSYGSYRTEYDNYNKFMHLYNVETDVVKVAEYKVKARRSHDKMDLAQGQIKMLSSVAGGIWLANAIHAFLVGPKREPSGAYRKPALTLAYNSRSHKVELRWHIALD